MREAGVGNYSFAVWWMIMTPAGTPVDVVNKLNAVFTKIADMPETKTFLSNVASLPLKGTPAEMVVKLDKDIETWAEIAKAATSCRSRRVTPRDEQRTQNAKEKPRNVTQNPQ